MQVAILVLSLILLPITPSDGGSPLIASDPTWRIVLLLAASVAFLILSWRRHRRCSRAWLARIDPALNPARFFAASNSRLLCRPALLSFSLRALFSRASSRPFCGHGPMPRMPRCSRSAHGWRSSQKAKTLRVTAAPAGGRVEGDRLALWILLIRCSALSFCSRRTTNAITQWFSGHSISLDCAAQSLSSHLCHRLWTSATLSPDGFHHHLSLSRCSRHLVTCADSGRDMTIQLALQCATMFFGCMICHAEMVRLQPEPARLPKFYLAISFGGALGGFFVALIAHGTPERLF